MKNSLPNYDFLGSVYLGTKANELEETLISIENQSLQPKNIFIVIDGIITNNVNDILKKYIERIPIKLIPIKKNGGLGLALRKGLKKCESKIVLRFDTDDVSFKERAYYIVKEIAENDIDIVGSNLYEFYDNPEEFVSKKIVPSSHSQIKRTIFFRNPINHNSVGFIRDSILKLNGGYRHFPFYEDYDLWIRAIFSGLKFKNINKSLLAMRISSQRSRRRGLNLIFMECRLFWTFFKISIFHSFLFLPSLILRIIFTLLPLKLVEFLFKYIFRKKLD